MKKTLLAVGLSASETQCEGKNEVDCVILDKNGVAMGKSKGPLTRWD